MNAKNGLTRREFLLLAAAFGTPLVPLRALFSLAGERAGSASDRLAALVRQRASARVIGAAYLAATPNEADAVVLADAIVAGLEGGAGALASHRADVAALRRLLARRVERDFAEGETVSLDGWILSRTEARLCGLARLQAPAA